MIRKQIDIYLEALAGYINDDDKLVTYKWLSKELGIHVNLSKQLLFEYWETQRVQKNHVISATFLLMGYVKEREMRVEVVKEDHMASAKEKFEKIISEHIYSLQKTLPEIELLAITDKGDSQLSAVHSSQSVLRSDHEMEVLRWGSALLANKQMKNNTQITAPKVRANANTESKLTDQAKNVKESGAKSTTNKTAAANSSAKTQKTAFNNFFAKAIDKQSKEKTSVKGVKSKPVASSSSLTTTSPHKNNWFEEKKKPISSDNKEPKENPENFSDSKKPKLNEDKEKSPKTNLPKKNAWFEAKKKPPSTSDKEAKVQVESCSDSKKANVEKFQEKSPQTEKVSKQESAVKNLSSGKTGDKKKVASSSRGKKRKTSSKGENTNKKRKRIVVISSDESSDDSETRDDIEEPDSSEEPPQVVERVKSSPSPPLVKCEGGRRKVRKLVDKTFVDEDGYFVTQKEYVYESCSDKEEEMPVEAAKPSTADVAAKTANKRKQVSLLNFFKKS
ncbi:DNA polymerase delta subunit 3-like isoform X1 [Neodiprion pinetum]|uniref:DNA polymerase delta subunit 3-like isoform X1 n=2 Tax=Neodiprion pinetum TaxID=441929 RepID=UPI001EDEAE69|nr:DNA polymerase delta subunit 3-like isoform X1 [Neodiprion pinetum]